MRRRTFLTLLAGTVACPSAVGAQQRAIPVVGYLSTRSVREADYVTAAFRQGLKETGYVEGQNVAIEFRSGILFGMAARAPPFIAGSALYGTHAGQPLSFGWSLRR